MKITRTTNLFPPNNSSTEILSVFILNSHLRIFIIPLKYLKIKNGVSIYSVHTENCIFYISQVKHKISI